MTPRFFVELLSPIKKVTILSIIRESEAVFRMNLLVIPINLIEFIYFTYKESRVTITIR